LLNKKDKVFVCARAAESSAVIR